jgi:hypothetical protein
MTPQNQDQTNDRQRRVRRVAGLAVGGALVASAAVALPALASNRVEPAEGAATTTTLSAIVTTIVPQAVPVATPAGPSLEEQVKARFAAMTPEELAAFALFTATDDQKAAFEKFVTPPPPPVVTPAPKAAAPNTAAPKTAAPAASTGGGAPSNGFLSCVRNRESRGNYSAYNPSGASGAYQMMPQTAANTARHAGRSDLAGKPVSQWSAADQDAMANHLYQWQGSAPWGGSC